MGDSSKQQTMPHATVAIPTADPCPHRIHSSLVRRLDKNVTVCPPCIMKHHIHNVKEIQAGFRDRGGVFVSRPKTRKSSDDSRWQAHLDLRARWRAAKIAALNDALKFEAWAKSEENKEAIKMLEEALGVWEKEVENLEVPGYNVGKEEVSDIVKRMMNELGNALGSIIAETDAAGDTPMTNSDANSMEPEDEDAEACPFPDSDVDTDSEDDVMVDAHDAREAHSTNGENGEHHPSPPSGGEEDEEEEHGKFIPMEAHTSTSRPDTPKPGDKKRVRFTDFAMVSPDTLTFVPSLFPDHPAGYPDSPDGLNIGASLLTILATGAPPKLSSQPTLHPHRHRTESPRKRHRHKFKRSSPQYRPSKWSSPPGYEKPDTGCFRMDWHDAELTWKLMDQEMEQEKKAFGTLNAISGTWVLTATLPTALWCYEKAMRDRMGLNGAGNGNAGADADADADAGGGAEGGDDMDVDV